MKRTKLVAARARKSWTLEQAAERIGCAPNTLSRWELGSMVASSYNRARLCAVYGVTTEELGLEEEAIRLADLPAMTGDLQVFLNADLTMRLLALVFTPQGNPLRLQAVLSRAIEEFTMDTGHEAALTRREALRRLAMLPVLFGISTGVQRPLEDILNQCAAGIAACEYLSKGESRSYGVSLLDGLYVSTGAQAYCQRVIFVPEGSCGSDYTELFIAACAWAACRRTWCRHALCKASCGQQQRKWRLIVAGDGTTTLNLGVS